MIIIAMKGKFDIHVARPLASFLMYSNVHADIQHCPTG